MCTLAAGAGDGFSFVAIDRGTFVVEGGEVAESWTSDSLIRTADGFAAGTGDGRWTRYAREILSGADLKPREDVVAALEDLRTYVAENETHDPEQLEISEFLAAEPGGFVRFGPAGVEEYGPGGAMYFNPPGTPVEYRGRLRQSFAAKVDPNDVSTVEPAVRQAFSAAAQVATQASGEFAVGLVEGGECRRVELDANDRVTIRAGV